ncbi:hypothetical protein ECG_03325 [Echinococcus granulosus]|uniref:Uncharacterized protein n=1 Tax=Echinococcus granulosus TaxID=6210 RepID=A0A068WVX5_ECHGR|nr:hypothetical protein ECG_03325 [Echinococcus granulosus]CDS23995.1 hypothetical protein EgrG_002048000 [Echinococcus granulosus]
MSAGRGLAVSGCLQQHVMIDDASCQASQTQPSLLVATRNVWNQKGELLDRHMLPSLSVKAPSTVIRGRLQARKVLSTLSAKPAFHCSGKVIASYLRIVSGNRLELDFNRQFKVPKLCPPLAQPNTHEVSDVLNFNDLSPSFTHHEFLDQS